MAIGVLVDANVLYSRTLRDWLFLLRNHANGDLYTVHTTEDILAEVIYSIRRNNPDAPGSLTSRVRDRIVDSLDTIVKDFVVDGSYPGDDPDDAHVHAAAVACGAEKLVTADDDFSVVPGDIDLQLPYEVHTPDSFFTLVDDSLPAVVRAATADQHGYWQNRPGAKTLDDALQDAQCPTFAARVSVHLEALRV